MEIEPVLKLAKLSGASDVHLVVNRPPAFRVSGSLTVVDDMPLSAEQIEIYLGEITTKEQREEFAQKLELDFGYTIPSIGRLRCNAARQQGAIYLVIRILPLNIPTIEDLGLPAIYKDLVLKKSGLIILSGPTGSGKSTSLATMINYLNRTERRRVVTIEDPIEYLYTSMKCLITQRELGVDTLSYGEALRHVLRQDPDVILIGEVRDLETVSSVLTMAETGHLILTTGHAPSTSQAVERIIDLFPPHERHLTQARLASLLVAVCCQALVPRADGLGRVAAVEVMLANSAVRNLIREGRTYQLSNTIRTHNRLGMQLMDQALLNLHQQNLITLESMLAFSHEPDETMKSLAAAEEAHPVSQ